MTRRILTLAIIASSFLMTNCKQAPVKSASEKTTYDIKTIEEVDFTTTSLYSATIRGWQDVDIYPQVAGYLSKILVDEGESVKRGQTLFIIEQAPFQAAYQAAKAAVAVAESQVANAELNFNNASNLYEKEIIAKAELLSAENGLNSAKAQLQLSKAQLSGAQTNLNFTVVKSPADGVVGKLPYRQGALVSAALPVSLTTISNNSQMNVFFSMGENQILNLMDTYGGLQGTVENMPAIDLILNNGTTYDHKGAVVSVSGVIDSNTGTVSLKAVFPNEERRLLSGGAGNVVINELHKNVITVPKTATYELQDRYFVYKVVDGVAKSTVVTLSKAQTDEEYIVTEGLKVGDRIIATGAGLVRDGAKVNQ